MFSVYILRSQVTGRFYTGSTSNLETRLQQHNCDQSTSTKNRGPWDLVHHEEFETLAEAVRRGAPDDSEVVVSRDLSIPLGVLKQHALRTAPGQKIAYGGRRLS